MTLNLFVYSEYLMDDLATVAFKFGRNGNDATAAYRLRLAGGSYSLFWLVPEP